MIGKFKVWDSDLKMFLGEGSKKYFINCDGLLYFDYWNHCGPAPKCAQAIFSTGKTDKNGVELFDGDIRENKIGKYIIEFGDYSAEDEFGDSKEYLGFYIRWVTKYDDDVSTFSDRRLSDTHLGNKFENPELLST